MEDYSISSPPGEQFPVYAVLSNGKVYGCDVIVSATGVTPNTSFVGDIPEVCGIFLLLLGGPYRVSVCDVIPLASFAS